MRMGVKTANICTEGAVLKTEACLKIWYFLLNSTFEFNFLKFKKPNLQKNLIRH